MGKLITIRETRSIGFDSYADPDLKPNEVRLATLYSGISAGTELTAYRGSNPYISKRWDDKTHLFLSGEKATLQYPFTAFGYEECGKVVETGQAVTSVKEGDFIFGAWGHRSHHVVTEDYAQKRILPANLEPILGIFSQIGAISLNGVLDAAVRIGETVAVFGLGTPGQIVAQLVKKSGARVIGVDLIDLRLSKAQELGAIDIAINAKEGGAAEQIKSLTNNRGADVAIEASGYYTALNESIRSVAYSAKVVALGFFQGAGQGLYLGEEFHHNRVNVVCSQIYGVSPELTYRWDPARLVQTAMRLQAENVLNLRPLITQVYPFSEAAEAYRMCDRESDKTIQVVLDYSE